MQQPTCRAQAASNEDDLAGNTRCFAEGTKEQKYGTNVYYFFLVSMAQRAREPSLNQHASKPYELAVSTELNSILLKLLTSYLNCLLTFTMR